MTIKTVTIIGGGTFNHVASHLALAAPSFGNTARQLKVLCDNKFEGMNVNLALTKMADHTSDIITNSDLEAFTDELINRVSTRVVFFSAAVCDFTGEVGGMSGKYSQRLKSSGGDVVMNLTPDLNKIVRKIREHRKDIFVVAFKTTCNVTVDEQFAAGLDMLKRNSVNLVIANDVSTRNNLLITPDVGGDVYKGSREALLSKAVDMAHQWSIK